MTLERVEAEGIVGDFNADGVLDIADINLLVTESASGANTPSFDLNADNLVNDGDINVWVKDLSNSWIGDANLDGEFNSSDLVAVFTQAKYEQDQDANWAQGDWTGDLRFGSSDLVAAFADAGFEQGPRAPQAEVVPEPSTLVLVLLGLGLIGSRLRCANGNHRPVDRLRS